MGDSYTEGVGVREEEAWPSVAQKRLGTGVEVLNLGVAGKPPAGYAEIVANLALLAQPTDVMVCLNSNDFLLGPSLPAGLHVTDHIVNPFLDPRTRVMRAIATLLPGWTFLFDRARGRWPKRTGSYFEGQPLDAETVAAGIAQKDRVSLSRARRLAAERLNRVEPAVLAAVQQGEFNPSMLYAELQQPYYLYKCRVQDMGIDADDLRQSTLQWLEWYGAASRAKGVRPWVLYFPVPTLVQLGPCGVMRDEVYRTSPQVYGDTTLRDLTERSCRLADVEFIDATPALLERAASRLFLRYDGHPSRAAQAAVGEHVAQVLGRSWASP